MLAFEDGGCGGDRHFPPHLFHPPHLGLFSNARIASLARPRGAGLMHPFRVAEVERNMSVPSITASSGL